MKLFAISIASWLAGLGAYFSALNLIWHQSASAGDLRAVVFWSAVASAVAIGFVYAPVMFAVSGRISSSASWWQFALVGIGLGLAPVAVIIGIFGGNLRSIWSPEALLFGFMFSTFGAVFGVGFFAAYGRRPG